MVRLVWSIFLKMENNSTCINSVNNLCQHKYIQLQQARAAKNTYSLISKINKQQKSIQAIEKNYENNPRAFGHSQIQNLIDNESQTELSFLKQYNTDVSDPINQYIIEEMKENCLKASHLHRYSIQFYDFASIIYFQSFSTYELLRRFLPLPSKQMINEHTCDHIKSIESQLFDISKIDNVIKTYQSNQNIESTQFIDACLSIDAVSLEKFVFNRLSKKNIHEKVFKNTVFIPGMPKSSTNQNGDLQDIPSHIDGSYFFVFNLQPYDTLLQCEPIHVYPHKSGQVFNDIFSIIDTLQTALIKHGIKIRNIAVDGDPGYDKFFNQMYNTIVDGKSIRDAIRTLDSPDLLWVSDPLHLLKCVRNRLVTRIVSPSLNIIDPLSLESIKDCLHLPERVFSTIQSDKMQDAFPIKLFSMSNLISLIESDNHNEASFFYPFVMLKEALMSTEISIQQRQYMLETTCYYTHFYINYVQSISTKKSYQSKNCLQFL